MKRFICCLCVSLILSSCLMAREENSDKPDSVLISEFKNTVNKRQIYSMSFLKAVKKIRDVQDKELLVKKKIPEDLMKIIKDETQGEKREMALDLIIFLKENNVKVNALYRNLIDVLKESESYYFKGVVISSISSKITPDMTVEYSNLKNTLLFLLSERPKLNNKASVIDLQASVFENLSNMGIKYSEIKTIVTKNLGNSKSDLNSAVLKFLVDFSENHSSFKETIIIKTLKKIIVNNTNVFMQIDRANAVTVLGNLLSNIDKRIEPSTESFLFDLLKDPSDEIITATCKTLANLGTTKAVEPMIAVAKQKSAEGKLDTMYEVIEYIAFLSENLTLVEKKDARTKTALGQIRDLFMNFLSKKGIKNELKEMIILSIKIMGGQSSDLVLISTLEGLVKSLELEKDEIIQEFIAKTLRQFTKKNYGTDHQRWARYLDAERKNPRSNFK